MENQPSKLSANLNRLIAGAIIDERFCELLLSNPEHTLQEEIYADEFPLSDVEKALLLSVSAMSLADLVTKLQEAYQNQDVPQDENND